jgi:hypothetical protein
MKLVIGRGNRRRVYEIPCANIVNRGDAAQIKILVNNVCEMLNIR